MPHIKSPSPPTSKPTNILLIKNLVRPFTLNQIKELLSRTGTIVENGFWMDRIKSKCIVEVHKMNYIKYRILQLLSNCRIQYFTIIQHYSIPTRIRLLRQDRHFMEYPGLCRIQRSFMWNTPRRRTWRLHGNHPRNNQSLAKPSRFHRIYGNRIGIATKRSIQLK